MALLFRVCCAGAMRFAAAVAPAEDLRHKREMQEIRAVVEKKGRTSKNEDLADGMARMVAKGLSCGLSFMWYPQP